MEEYDAAKTLEDIVWDMFDVPRLMTLLGLLVRVAVMCSIFGNRVDILIGLK